MLFRSHITFPAAEEAAFTKKIFFLYTVYNRKKNFLQCLLRRKYKGFVDYGSDEEDDKDAGVSVPKDAPLGHLTMHSLSRKRSVPASLAAVLRVTEGGFDKNDPFSQQQQPGQQPGMRKLGMQSALTRPPPPQFEFGEEVHQFDSLFDQKPPSLQQQQQGMMGGMMGPFGGGSGMDPAGRGIGGNFQGGRDPFMQQRQQVPTIGISGPYDSAAPPYGQGPAPSAPQRKPRIKIRSRDSSLQSRPGPGGSNTLPPPGRSASAVAAPSQQYLQQQQQQQQQQQRASSPYGRQRPSSMVETDPQGFLQRMQDMVKDAEIDDGFAQPVWPATVMPNEEPPPLRPVSPGGGRRWEKFVIYNNLTNIIIILIFYLFQVSLQGLSVNSARRRRGRPRGRPQSRHLPFPPGADGHHSAGAAAEQPADLPPGGHPPAKQVQKKKS